jgi:hypothetical protein
MAMLPLCKQAVDSSGDSNAMSSHPNDLALGWKIHAAAGRYRTLTDSARIYGSDGSARVERFTVHSARRRRD